MRDYAELVEMRRGPALSVPPVRVSGPEPSPKIAAWQRRQWNQRDWPAVPIMLLEIEDALVLSRGLTFRADGTLVSATAEFFKPEEVAQESAAFGNHLARATYIDEDALLAIRPGSNCYGHILTEILGSAWVGASLLGDRRFSLLAAARPHLEHAYTEIASHAGLLARPYINEVAPLRVRRLYVVEGFALTDRYLSPLLADFARVLLESCGARQAPNRKLYVRRSPQQRRAVSNEDEVWRELRARGFEEVLPETLKWADQVRLFAQASHLVGPMGSGLANALFSPRGARLLSLAPVCMADSFFWRLAGIVGVDYEELRCPSVESDRHQQTWTAQDQNIVVDLELLTKWLDS